MKLKLLAIALFGASLSAVTAGEWCPPADKCPVKCPVECCEPSGSISVGYDTDYIWKGVRWARDSVWGDVNYTFENLPFSPNIGVWHLSSLGSGATGNDGYGDEFNAYAGITLPSLLGFDLGAGYTWYAYPTDATGLNSVSSPNFTVSRDIWCGVTLSYMIEYFTGASDVDAWYHTLGLAKSFDITDCISLDLAAEVAYSDNLHGGPNNASKVGRSDNSGFNSYLISAGLSIPVGCSATLSPYIAYTGSPDGWVADGFNPTPVNGGNANDVFFGGVSISVGF